MGGPGSGPKPGQGKGKNKVGKGKIFDKNTVKNIFKANAKREKFLHSNKLVNKMAKLGFRRIE
jgi:hypothetical protein